MEKLSDRDFDQIFKNKIKNGYLVFEEESWLKMEKKLRRRDRFVFYRNASIILLFLSFGMGIYLTTNKEILETDIKTVEKSKKIDASQENNENLTKDEDEETQSLPNIKMSSKSALKIETSALKSEIITSAKVQSTSENVVVDRNKKLDQNIETKIAQTQTTPPIETVPIEDYSKEIKKLTKRKVKLPISFAISAGPDFNSTEKIIGGKSSLAIGIGVGVGLTKRLSVQTGINYGAKNYSASSYDYTFANPNARAIISRVEAVCEVLEIPIAASYTIIDNSKNKINLNAGLSSYLMLKENYTYKYIAAVRADRLIEVNNSNQHFLSVVDLSATYFIKLKNKNFALGFEPYLKIPLSGIGEGRVPLKSSGISLKLNYELNKKN